MIAKCACGSKPHSQDDLHGKGNRVFNHNPKKEEAKCTVCGATLRVPKEDKEKK